MRAEERVRRACRAVLRQRPLLIGCEPAAGGGAEQGPEKARHGALAGKTQARLPPDGQGVRYSETRRRTLQEKKRRRPGVVAERPRRFMQEGTVRRGRQPSERGWPRRAVPQDTVQ